MPGRRSWPLAWRGAALASAAIGLLTVVASIAAFVVVRDSLRSTLERALRDDAARVAALYRTGAAGSVREQLAGPTGGVIVQLYDPLGALLVASDGRYAQGDAALPPEALAAARDVPRAWRGTLADRPVQAALTPFEFGVVAVVAAKPGMSSKGTSCSFSMQSRMPSSPVPGRMATCTGSGATLRMAATAA